MVSHEFADLLPDNHGVVLLCTAADEPLLPRDDDLNEVIIRVVYTVARTDMPVIYETVIWPSEGSE